MERKCVGRKSYFSLQCVEGCGLPDRLEWPQTMFYFWFPEWPFAKCSTSAGLCGLPTPAARKHGSGMHGCLAYGGVKPA